MALFRKYKVLSKRELEARFEVFTEQYVVKINIEAETAAAIARTLLLPAAIRHLALVRESGIESLVAETSTLLEEFVEKIGALEAVNAVHPAGTPLRHAIYMRDEVVAAMEGAREVADRLERIVADDLWPLPKYAEMLFIK